MESQHEKLQKPNQVRVLSLDGGGARGMFTISVLAEIERIIEESTGRQNVRAGDYFDLITGTSIGGIVALGLAVGKSAREIEAKFREDAPKIFPRRWGWWKTAKALICPIYSSKPLRKSIDDMIGSELRFRDLERRVMIPTVNLTTGRPQFLKTPHDPTFTRDAKVRLIDAALATSAAPTYFAPHYCELLSAHFADGGLVANSPSYVGLREVLLNMQTDFPGRTEQDVFILNIGTLAQEYTVPPKALKSRRCSGYMSLWGAGKHLVLATMTANQHLHRNMLIRELRNLSMLNNFLCLDDTVPTEAAREITLDNASETALDNLTSRGKQLAHEVYAQNPALKAFFSTPAKPFTPPRSEDDH